MNDKTESKSDPEKMDGKISIYIFVIFSFTLWGLYTFIQLDWSFILVRFKEDPFTSIFIFTLIVIGLIILPLIISLDMKTVCIENFKMRVNYVIRFKKVEFNIDEIKKCNFAYRGDYREKFEIVLNDDRRVKIKAFEISNFRSVRNYILKYHKAEE